MATLLFYFVYRKNVSKFTIRESFKKNLCAVLFQWNYLKLIRECWEHPEQTYPTYIKASSDSANSNQAQSLRLVARLILIRNVRCWGETSPRDSLSSVTSSLQLLFPSLGVILSIKNTPCCSNLKRESSLLVITLIQCCSNLTCFALCYSSFPTLVPRFDYFSLRQPEFFSEERIK